MIKFVSSTQLALILLNFFLLPTAECGGLALVTNLSSPINKVTQKQISKRWLFKSRFINNYEVQIIDLSEKNPLRNEFYQNVVGITDQKLKAFWAIKVFRGEGFPPDMLKHSKDVLEWVNQKPNRIGYVNSDSVDRSVKVIFCTAECSNSKYRDNYEHK